MAGILTNRGCKLMLEHVFRGVALPTKFYVALVTDGVIPDREIETLSELTQIVVGNGYTAGGFELTPGVTDFDTITQDDVNHRATLQIKDLTWTATGGNIPPSGDGASYAVLTDDNGTVGNRQVY